MQQRVWYLEQLQLGRTVFNVPSAHRLHGALDVAALGRAFTELRVQSVFSDDLFSWAFSFLKG